MDHIDEMYNYEPPEQYFIDRAIHQDHAEGNETEDLARDPDARLFLRVVFDRFEIQYRIGQSTPSLVCNKCKSERRFPMQFLWPLNELLEWAMDHIDMCKERTASAGGVQL